MNRFRIKCWLAALFAASLFGIQAAHADPARTVIAPSPASWSQPANIGLLELQATAYHDGAYMRDCAAVDDEVAAWLRAQAPRVQKPALVLDIDETSLSNWDEIKANGFGFFSGGSCDHLPQGPCGFTAWQHESKAAVLAPTLELVGIARRLGVAVFFITGRHDPAKADTAANLLHAGYHDWAGLSLEPEGSHFASAVDFKAPVRATIEARGYTILATVGDQRSDLLGGHAMRGFLLPNPFYFIP